MKHLKTIVGINLLVMLVYSLLIRLINGGGGTGNDKGLGILIMSAVVISAHVFICLVTTGFMYRKSSSIGNAWLLSSGIVLLVGFSSCWGNASL